MKQKECIVCYENLTTKDKNLVKYINSNNIIKILLSYYAFIKWTLVTLKIKKNICNYLDIPLQHISDNVLHQMRRQISKQEIISFIKNIREEVMAEQQAMHAGEAVAEALSEWKGSMVLVSHDTEFVERLADCAGLRGTIPHINQPQGMDRHEMGEMAMGCRERCARRDQ